VNALAELFHTSQTATAIRLVEGDHSPALLVCHGKLGRKWFVRAPSVPQHWFPRDALDPDSFAFGVLYGGNSDDDALPRKIGAETICTGEDEILTLILISDAHMLEDRDDRGATAVVEPLRNPAR
jgi:hypothetical protein